MSVPDMLPPQAGRYTKIPGPLGIESAMLKGKVALVTGSGMSLMEKNEQTSWVK